MIRLGFLIASLILFGSEQLPSTTDWRGLSPVKSTRMDVERTLGRPDQNLNNEMLTYRFQSMEVDFYFTTNPKCQKQLPSTSWDVPSDTVTAIDVTFRPQPLVADTGIDLTEFKKIEAGGDLLKRYLYFSADDSFIIEVGSNYLAGYHYRPGTSHKDLRCEATKKN